MRITNQMIQNSSLYNMNKNKISLDKAQKQVITGKKISRPSEDPIIAMRSLRFSSVLSQVDQYLNRNIKDAKSWLNTTSVSLTSASNILDNLINKANQGSNGYYKSEDLDVLLTNISSLSDEFYNIASDDYSGRYIFGGFRTSTSLTFMEETSKQYDIIEDNLSVENYKYIDYSDISDIKNYKLQRIKLSYDDIDSSDITLKINDDNYNVSSISQGEAYQLIKEANDNNEEAALFIKETGEIICSDKMAEKLNNGFNVKYSKTNWKGSDLRPEHYFDCVSDGVNYEKKPQDLNYDIGYSQSIKVNTTASEVFSFDIKKSISDLKNKLLDLKDIEKIKQSSDYEENKDEIDKSYDTLKDNINKLMNNSIAVFQKIFDSVNLVSTDIGTRYNRVEMVESRLEQQYANISALKSDNEDIDLTEAAINLTYTKNAYEASLLATSKIANISLLDYLR